MKKLTQAELNEITVQISKVLSKHGLPARANESRNYIRSHLVDWLEEWFETTYPDDWWKHTDWSKV